MKKFREANADLYEISIDEKLAHDLALITEKGEDMCAIPIDMLRSKVMKDRHKKLCKGKKHWSTTDKKAKKSMWSKKAQRAAASGGHKLHNSVEEGTDDNLIVLIRDITSQMIGAIKKNDERKLKGLYKNLGKVIK